MLQVVKKKWRAEAGRDAGREDAERGREGNRDGGRGDGQDDDRGESRDASLEGEEGAVAEHDQKAVGECGHSKEKDKNRTL